MREYIFEMHVYCICIGADRNYSQHLRVNYYFDKHLRLKSQSLSLWTYIEKESSTHMVFKTWTLLINTLFYGRNVWCGSADFPTTVRPFVRCAHERKPQDWLVEIVCYEIDDARDGGKHACYWRGTCCGRAQMGGVPKGWEGGQGRNSELGTCWVNRMHNVL